MPGTFDKLRDGELIDSFDVCVEIILEHEGGYAWYENDPGGETNMGIAKK